MPIAAIGAVASIGSAALGASAAKKGAKSQARAAEAAAAEQQRQFDLIQQNQAPFREAGVKALNQLMGLYGLNQGAQEGTGRADYSAFLNSPDYQFALQQGQQAVDRSAAARGLLNSGNTLAAAQQYGQGLASQQLGNYRNSLMGLIGGGQEATGQLAQAGLQTGANVGNALMAGGNARASGALGSANALIGGLGGLGQAAQDYFSSRNPVSQPGIGSIGAQYTPVGGWGLPALNNPNPFRFQMPVPGS